MLSQILQRMDSLEVNTLNRLDTLEKIVRDLDRFKFWMMGVAAVAGIAGAKIGSFFKP